MTFCLIILLYTSLKIRTFLHKPILQYPTKWTNNYCMSPSTQSIFGFLQLLPSRLLLLVRLSQDPHKDHILHLVDRSLRSLLIQDSWTAVSSGMCLDKAFSLGNWRGHRRLCSWPRVLGPIIILHIINSKSDEVLLALVQNLLAKSGAKDTDFQKVCWNPYLIRFCHLTLWSSGRFSAHVCTSVWLSEHSWSLCSEFWL